MSKKSTLKSPEPHIGIDNKERSLSIDILNEVLANEFVLLVQTLNYHWNVEGVEFFEYHKLFDEQYHALFDFLDEIAERIRALGGIAIASMAEVIKNAELTEDTGDIPDPLEMVEHLLQQHEKCIQELRYSVDETQDHGDMGTSNFLTDLMEKHEKMAWMLRAITAH